MTISTQVLGWQPQGKTGLTTRWRDPDTGQIMGERDDKTRLGSSTRLGKMFQNAPESVENAEGSSEPTPVVSEAPEAIPAPTEAILFTCQYGCGKTSPTKAGIRAHERSHA